MICSWLSHNHGLVSQDCNKQVWMPRGDHNTHASTNASTNENQGSRARDNQNKKDNKNNAMRIIQETLTITVINTNSNKDSTNKINNALK